MASDFDFPAVMPNDPNDVALAVETARALYRRGDSRDALRWLRRAAESAEEEGDDLRALSLARAAADLQDRLPKSAAPPAAGPLQPSQPPVGALSSWPPPAVSPVPPASNAPPPNTVPPAARNSSPPSQRGAPRGLEPWAPPASRPAPAQAAPVQATPVKAAPAQATPVKAAPAQAAPVKSDKAPIEPATPPMPMSIAPIIAPEPSPSVVPPATPGPSIRPALRVSVEVLSRSSGTFVVRILGENESLTAGQRAALLVPLDASTDLRSL